MLALLVIAKNSSKSFKKRSKPKSRGKKRGKVKKSVTTNLRPQKVSLTGHIHGIVGFKLSSIHAQFLL